MRGLGNKNLENLHLVIQSFGQNKAAIPVPLTNVSAPGPDSNIWLQENVNKMVCLFVAW